MAIVAACAGAALALVAGSASGLGNVEGGQTQTEAGPHIFLPSTTPCTEEVVKDAMFSGYYNPVRATYDPSTCPGPWSKVVLTLSASVGGVQFDRLVDVRLGNAAFLHGSTSEPANLDGSDTSWTIQRDVTQYSSMLTQSQQMSVYLDTVTDATYTGVYDVDVSLTFYPVAQGQSAPSEPNVVLPVTQSDSVNSNDGPMFTLSDSNPPSSELQGSSVTFPRNLDRLEAEVFASGGGTCEEFWWTDPGGCAGTPYREADIEIDGKLAGAAPVYPSAFTGFDGPEFWEPIPSPRAWDLRPYDIDLTPFIGELSDGQSHQIQFSVADAAYGDDSAGTDYWKVAANLLGWTDPSLAITGGTVTPESNLTAPTEIPNDPTGQGVPYTDAVTHSLMFAGTVDTSQGIENVRDDESMSEDALQASAGSVNGDWTWNSATTTTEPNGTKVVDSDDRTYSAQFQADANFDFTDDDTVSDTTNGTSTYSEGTTESMSTANALENPLELVEQECYTRSDSAGDSYTDNIQAVGGNIIGSGASQPCLPTTALDTLASTVVAAGSAGTTGTTGMTTTTTPTDTTTGTTTTGTTTTGTGTTPTGTTTTTTTTSDPTQPTPIGVSTPIPVTGVRSPPTVVSCTAPRILTFAQHPSARVREIKAIVYVNGRRVERLKRHRITAVSLSRPRASDFTLRLVAYLSNGEVISHTIDYRGCSHSPAKTKELRRPRRSR